MIIVETLFLLFFILFAIKAKPVSTLCFMFFLLPIHGTLKVVLFSHGGNIFAIWKEIGILILLYRAYNFKVPTKNSLYKLILIFFAYALIFLGIGLAEKYSVTNSIKKLFFPCLLTLTISKINFSRTDILKIFSYCLLGSIIINISAVADFLSPSVRMFFRDLMKVGYVTGGDGTVYYDISSFKIMGIDRACGLIAGGPNQLGIFNSGIVTIGIMSFVCFKDYLRRKTKFWWYSIFFLSAFSLIVSFSRAGWAMVILTIFFLFFIHAKFRSKVLAIFFIAAILSSIAYFTIPAVETVVDGTFTGKEASSAARGNMTQNSLSILINNPWGYGLGAANHSVSNYVAFAESSWINFGFEIGIIGVLLLFAMLAQIALNTKNNHGNDLAKFSLSFLFAYSITSLFSVNTFENPYIYYAWLIMGIGTIRWKNEVIST